MLVSNRLKILWQNLQAQLLGTKTAINAVK